MPNGLPALTKHNNIVSQLRQLLDSDIELRQLAEQSLQLAACANTHLSTNPVRDFEEWFEYMDRFLHCMPWQAMDIGEDASFFSRIDQNIGYFYFLIDQPLDALANRGYIYPSLQYEPRIAAWLREYNATWGEWLNGPHSWNDTYYMLARKDSRFDLHTDRYESHDNWHCWNDFFARRLREPIMPSVNTIASPCDGVIASAPVKTATIEHWLDLLGNSKYRKTFEGGETTHIVLDVFDYHRFHAPCNGTVLECRTIQGIHAGGGVIIWDETQGRYRYKQTGATDFQMLETRGVMVLDTPTLGKLAVIPVGVQQVSSVVWNKNVTQGAQLQQGDEIGRFLCGGSDVVLLFEQNRAPRIAANKRVKAGEIMD